MAARAGVPRAKRAAGAGGCAPPVPDNSRTMPSPTRRHGAAIALALALLAGCAGCTTGPPGPVSADDLAQIETFPYYKVYWVGRSFLGHPLTAVGGIANYNPINGESAYYGTCASGGGLLGEGACSLPLLVTTLVFVPHSNKSLGPQQNQLIRGVPATLYDHGRSIELYSGHLAIQLTSDTPAHALLAARTLRPLNASGTPGEALPQPTYCPGFVGAVGPRVATVMAQVRRMLPPRACPPMPRLLRRRRPSHVPRSRATGATTTSTTETAETGA